MLKRRSGQAYRVAQLTWRLALVGVLVTGLIAVVSMTPSHVIGGVVSILSGLTLGFVSRS
jgi:uncharacterized membrane protein (GlpM family)